MNCQEVMAAVSEYLEQGTRSELCAGIEAHLHRCPRCQAHVRTLDRTITMVRKLGGGSVQEEIVVRLRSRIVKRPGSGERR